MGLERLREIKFIFLGRGLLEGLVGLREIRRRIGYQCRVVCSSFYLDVRRGLEGLGIV